MCLTTVAIAGAMQIKQDQRKQQHDPVAQATKQYQQHQQHQQRKSEQCRVHLKVRLFLGPQCSLLHTHRGVNGAVLSHYDRPTCLCLNCKSLQTFIMAISVLSEMHTPP